MRLNGDRIGIVIDQRIHHLQMIQAVIARMAESSAAMKRYCLVIVAAAMALAAGAGLAVLPLIAIGLVLMFWVLDAAYLRQERWFRVLYDQVREEPEDRPADFRITPSAQLRQENGLGKAWWSWSTAGLYLPLVLFLAIVSAVIR